MKYLERLSEWFGKHMAAIVLVVAALALLKPETCAWVKLTWINTLLAVVMFGMGLTLKFSDFKIVFSRPKDIFVGALAQFTLMPLLAFFLGKLFGLETGLLAGVVLVGACPGGTSSNVVSYLSKGDVALSVGMTSVNTLLAPILTPAIVYLLLHTSVDVDVAKMFVSILQVVLVPIALGLVIDRFFERFTSRVAKALPLVSVLAISAIVAAVVSHNAERILATGFIVFGVVILHNVLGYASGYAVGRALKLPLAKRKTLAVEIGMQNSGLATSLASSAFAAFPLAAVPGAVFSVWHNISGAILAQIFSRMKGDATEITDDDAKKSARNRRKNNKKRSRR